MLCCRRICLRASLIQQEVGLLLLKWRDSYASVLGDEGQCYASLRLLHLWMVSGCCLPENSVLFWFLFQQRTKIFTTGKCLSFGRHKTEAEGHFLNDFCTLWPYCLNRLFMLTPPQKWHSHISYVLLEFWTTCCLFWVGMVVQWLAPLCHTSGT